ncbi:predicted protein [Plenodomus lingam JN3]|uniref:Uncharacterized protein n=1 Tax=Leptosphaeria maculans (strain JN3 / isolate v23.1.3 / race Av1-4-5-6-7-8) TaxID=985895 RepID=E4ZFZ6_LEPMJ|nr:predicted protein [Plenodomus lingam JN3]CBX90216.1 predicted protein [Plenodomus lingam JN3]
MAPTRSLPSILCLMSVLVHCLSHNVSTCGTTASRKFSVYCGTPSSPLVGGRARPHPATQPAPGKRMSSTTSSTHGSPDSPLIQPFPLSLSSPCRDLSMCPDLHTFEGTFPDGRRCGWTRSPILQAINALPSPLTRPILIRRPVRKAGSSNKPSPFAVPLAFLRFFFPPLRPRPDAAIPCWRQYRAHVPAPRQFCICSLSPSLVQPFEQNSRHARAGSRSFAISREPHDWSLSPDTVLLECFPTLMLVTCAGAMFTFMRCDKVDQGRPFARYAAETIPRPTCNWEISYRSGSRPGTWPDRQPSSERSRAIVTLFTWRLRWMDGRPLIGTCSFIELCRSRQILDLEVHTEKIVIEARHSVGLGRLECQNKLPRLQVSLQICHKAADAKGEMFQAQQSFAILDRSDSSGPLQDVVRRAHSSDESRPWV